jgi:hypothetical protein
MFECDKCRRYSGLLILLHGRAPKSSQNFPITFAENGAALNHALQESLRLKILAYCFINPVPRMADCTTGLNRGLEFVFSRNTMDIVNRVGSSKRRARQQA